MFHRIVRNFIFLGTTTVFAVVVVFSAHAAWQGPTSAPPDGNVAAPLNTGPLFQRKSGALFIDNDVTIGSGKAIRANNSGGSILNFGNWVGSTQHPISLNILGTSSKLTTPELCLGTECKTGWPSAGAGAQNLLQVLRTGADASAFTNGVTIGGTFGSPAPSTGYGLRVKGVQQGVYGEATGTHAPGTVWVYGVQGYGANAVGVYGRSNTKFGVEGSSTSSAGVRGTGTTGVEGVTTSTGGAGISGAAQTNASGASGVRGTGFDTSSFAATFQGGKGVKITTFDPDGSGSLAPIGGDLYFDDAKAIRVDKSSASRLNIGNWGGTGGAQQPVNLQVLGTGSKITTPQLCLGSSCRTSWPATSSTPGLQQVLETNNQSITKGALIDVRYAPSEIYGLTVHQKQGATGIFAALPVSGPGGGTAIIGSASPIGGIGVEGTARDGTGVRGRTQSSIAVLGSIDAPIGQTRNPNAWAGQFQGRTYIESLQVGGVYSAPTANTIGTVTAGRYCLAGSCLTNWPSASSGLTQTDADARYVNVSGDTMTGPLTVGTAAAGNDVIFYGTFTGGRLFWDASKQALRAGLVTGEQWNDTNVGLYSFATGSNATARGTSSIASGSSSVASGTGSLATGIAATASGSASLAVGSYTTASGNSATAFGQNTSATRTAATAIGSNTLAGGPYSFAGGYLTKALNIGDFAFGGSTTEASGGFSVAIGPHARSSGALSMAFGQQVTAEASRAIVLGSGASDTSRLVNRTEDSLMVGFKSTTPSLVVTGTDVYAGPISDANKVCRKDGTNCPTSEGLDQTTADGRYVNVSGDTMTGPLTVGSAGAGHDIVLHGNTAGARLFWDASKYAFRTGGAPGFEWNDPNVGYYSFAAGLNTKASGDYAVALGQQTQASGQSSTAMGRGTAARGFYSTALGFNTIASGPYSTALGFNTIASGIGAMATGQGTTARGSVSTAMGYNASALHNYSVVFGFTPGTTCATTGTNQFKICGNQVVTGTKSFEIPHPTKPDWFLRHSAVESPTAGDNLYRWTVTVEDGKAILPLPDYYQYVNENDMVWVSPVGHFGRAYGEVDTAQKNLTIHADVDGEYNVLLVGTRKDPTAKSGWKGVEIQAE